jgi:hypothetical protein
MTALQTGGLAVTRLKQPVSTIEVDRRDDEDEDMKRSKQHGEPRKWGARSLLAFAGVAVLMVLAAVLPLSAAAVRPEVTTMHLLPQLPSDGSPAYGTLDASGGVFGDGVNGTFVAPCRFTSGGSFCVNTTTTPNGTFSFAEHARCRLLTATQLATELFCEGTWHLVDGTGDYTGAQGGGTFTAILTFPEAGDAFGESWWTGRTHFVGPSPS